MPAKKPNILFVMGDDIGWFNISVHNRIAKEGALFTDWHRSDESRIARSRLSGVMEEMATAAPHQN